MWKTNKKTQNKKKPVRHKRQENKAKLYDCGVSKYSGNMWYWDLKSGKAKWAMNGKCSEKKRWNFTGRESLYSNSDTSLTSTEKVTWTKI